MQWLVIALLVSVGTLLLAAAGVARHIRLHHTGPRDVEPVRASGSSDEADLESEP
jgi:hypothetical protein